MKEIRTEQNNDGADQPDGVSSVARLDSTALIVVIAVVVVAAVGVAVYFLVRRKKK